MLIVAKYVTIIFPSHYKLQNGTATQQIISISIHFLEWKRMGSKDADSREKKPAGLDDTSLPQSCFFSQSLDLLSFSQKKENKQNVPPH